jgi:hypothetical protein
MSEKLVLMEKDGEKLEVHPTCVEAHELAGWKKAKKEEPSKPQPAPELKPEKE